MQRPARGTPDLPPVNAAAAMCGELQQKCALMTAMGIVSDVMS